MQLVARNHQLDGLRGCAAIMVSVFHTILCMDENLIPRIVYGDVSKLPDAYSWLAKVILKLFSGETAVFIFFVLSGAVLFQSLMGTHRSLFSQSLVFTVRRVARIYPALIVCLGIMAAHSFAIGRPVSFYDFAANAALYAFPINGATWTLNVEVVAIGFILIVYVGWRAGSEWGLIAAAVGVGIALQSSWFQSVAVTFKDLWIYFVLGMIVPTRLGNWIARMMPVMAWPGILFVALMLKGTLQQGAIALLVTMLYYNKAGFLGDALERPVPQFFGRISYSFYLYNVLVFGVVCGYVKQWPLVTTHPIEAGLLASIPVICITMAFGYLSMRFVETPGIRFGRAISRRPLVAAVQQ